MMPEGCCFSLPLCLTHIQKHRYHHSQLCVVMLHGKRDFNDGMMYFASVFWHLTDLSSKGSVIKGQNFTSWCLTQGMLLLVDRM